MNRIRTAFFCFLIAAVAASAAVDPALLSLVMPDAKVISGIQVESSKASPFGKYVLSQMQSDDEGFRKFISETGFDPRTDLTEIVVATGAKGDRTDVLVLGRGIFNPGRIGTAARAAGAGLLSYQGVDVFTAPDKNNGAVAVLDGSTAVMGSLEAVKAAIDRRQSGGGALPAEVRDKMRDLSARNDAWFMTTGPLSEFFAGKIADPNLSGAMQGNLLQAVLQANGGIKFGTDVVQISGEALTRSDKDAGALADVVRFIAGLVRLNQDNDEQAKKIASLLDSMQVTTQASTMRMTLSIPESMVEKLFVPQARPAKPARARKTASLH